MTIGELAKGTARTAETSRRFARGFGEGAERLLRLAGFAEAIDHKEGASSEKAPPTQAIQEPNGELHPWLERFGTAPSALPPGQTRSLLMTRLRRDTELLESLLMGDAPDVRCNGNNVNV